jgi:hypothetical protein
LTVTEAQVTQAVLAKWGSHPRLRFYRTNTGAAMIKGRLVTFGVRGQADYTGMIRPEGRYIALEFKRSKGGKQSEDQIAFQRFVESCGGVYVLCPVPEAMDAAMAALGIAE